MVWVVIASMSSFIAVRCQASCTVVTGPEEPRQCRDDIRVVVVVQEDQLFVPGWSKRFDTITSRGIDK